MLSALEQASGVLVMGLVLADIFLTVLYARSSESDAWRTRFAEAVRQISSPGIEALPNEADAEIYLTQRARWQPHIARLAPLLTYHIDELKPGGDKRR